MIDTHIHADSRSSEDFEMMYLSGIDSAVTCSFYPYKLYNETVLLNHLERILEYDTTRAKKYGINLKVALGIHPSNTEINPQLIYNNMYQWIENNKIIAIGEIGLENLTENEINIFKKQLEIGEQTKTPVIIHTPRKNKFKVFQKIIDIVPGYIDPNLVVIDHINGDIVKEAIDSECMLGLTVQPGKMTKEEAICILDQYGFDRFLLNSDISNMPSDCLSVPKTVRELKKEGYDERKIEKVAFKNARNFFKI